MRETRRGFTLIELLVVVSIMAVLMGILVPSLKTAKGSAKDAICKTNLRSILLAQTLFLQDHRRFQALNQDANDGAWQFNYVIWSGHDWHSNFGPLITNKKLLQEPKLMFCPFQKDPRHMLDTSDNPWPPNQGFTTRAGYGRRHRLSGRPLTDFRKNIAVYSDLIHLPKVVKSAHKKGVNAAYIDGHVSWVSNPGIFTDNELGIPFSMLDNPIVDQIWKVMDGPL